MLVKTYSKCTLVLRAELSVHDCIGELEVGFRFLVALQHEHAAAQIVVNSRCVDSIAAKTQLSNLPRHQEAPQRPGRLINVIEDGAEAAVWEGLVRMIVV